MEPKIKLDELLDKFEDTITISNPGALLGAIGGGYASDTITLSGTPWNATNNTIIGGGYSYPNVSPNSGTYSISGAGTNASPWATYNPSAKIKLDGADADIEVNGESLIGMIRRMEERLNILTPNTKLEAEWEELRALGAKYRELEQHIKDKQATWDRLKAMPAPVID